MENKKLSRIYYSPKGFWKGLPAVKKLSQEAGVTEDEAKLWADETGNLADLFASSEGEYSKTKF